MNILPRVFGAACLLMVMAIVVPGFAQTLETPVRLKAGGELIDTDIGHAAPFVHDFDGDGVRDLLVGQFGKGKLRLYRNTGTNQAPNYAKPEWFQAGGKEGTVPAG